MFIWTYLSWCLCTVLLSLQRTVVVSVLHHFLCYIFPVSDYDFECRSPDTSLRRPLSGHGLGFGEWTQQKDCPVGSYICGIRTQVEFPQGYIGDDTSLNDATFYCCKFIRPWWVYFADEINIFDPAARKFCYAANCKLAIFKLRSWLDFYQAFSDSSYHWIAFPKSNFFSYLISWIWSFLDRVPN